MGVSGFIHRLDLYGIDPLKLDLTLDLVIYGLELHSLNMHRLDLLRLDPHVQDLLFQGSLSSPTTPRPLHLCYPQIPTTYPTLPDPYHS